MKALVLDSPGKPDGLYTTDIPTPSPGPDEVLVKVHAVGLNPADYKLAASGNPEWDYPFVLGLDVAGVVEEVGSEVAEWEVGDPVYYHGNLSKPGGYGQFAIAPAHTLAWLPDGLSYVDAAALPCAGFAAYQALHRKLRVQSGKTILIHGGAGGVGGFAVQLARAAGLVVYATCSPHNERFVKDLGATQVIHYKTEDVGNRIAVLTEERGVDYIIDTVGQESATNSLEMLAFGGEIACFAGLPDLGDYPHFSKGISIHEIALSRAYESGDRAAQEDLAKIAREFGAMVSKGTIKPMLEETISLEDIPDALTRLALRHVRGKIVAKIALS
jgi:NADPH:quinone reductase